MAAGSWKLVFLLGIGQSTAHKADDCWLACSSTWCVQGRDPSGDRRLGMLSWQQRLQRQSNRHTAVQARGGEANRHKQTEHMRTFVVVRIQGFAQSVPLTQAEVTAKLIDTHGVNTKRRLAHVLHWQHNSYRQTRLSEARRAKISFGKERACEGTYCQGLHSRRAVAMGQLALLSRSGPEQRHSTEWSISCTQTRVYPLWQLAASKHLRRWSI